MRRKIRGLWVLLVIGLIGNSCSPSTNQPSATPSQPNTRPSESSAMPPANKIKVTSVVPMHFPNGEDALVMNCETGTAMTNSATLRSEVDEIWKVFMPDVEKANLTNGVIRVVHAEGSGLFTHSKGYGFVFVKRKDGNWYCLQDEQK